MLNPYLSLTEAELLDQRGDLLSELKRLRTGQSLLSTGSAGKNATLQRARLSELREELQLTQFALSRLNPTAHGRMVTATYSDFSH